MGPLLDPLLEEKESSVKSGFPPKHSLGGGGKKL